MPQKSIVALISKHRSMINRLFNKTFIKNGKALALTRKSAENVNGKIGEYILIQFLLWLHKQMEHLTSHASGSKTVQTEFPLAFYINVAQCRPPTERIKLHHTHIHAILTFHWYSYVVVVPLFLILLQFFEYATAHTNKHKASAPTTYP